MSRLTDAQVEGLRDVDHYRHARDVDPRTVSSLIRRGLLRRDPRPHLGALVYLTDAGRATLEATADRETTPEGKARRLFERHLRHVAGRG